MKFKIKDRKQKVVNGTTIQLGMPLVDNQGNYIGKVKEIHHKGFVVDRAATNCTDIFVPYRICVHAGADQLMLDITQKEADAEEWPENDCA